MIHDSQILFYLYKINSELPVSFQHRPFDEFPNVLQVFLSIDLNQFVLLFVIVH